MLREATKCKCGENVGLYYSKKLKGNICPPCLEISSYLRGLKTAQSCTFGVSSLSSDGHLSQPNWQAERIKEKIQKLIDEQVVPTKNHRLDEEG